MPTLPVDLNRGTALLPFQKSPADPDADLDADICLAPLQTSAEQIYAVAFSSGVSCSFLWPAAGTDDSVPVCWLSVSLGSGGKSLHTCPYR